MGLWNFCFIYMYLNDFFTYFQLASAQCLLTVELCQFQNLHNVVFANLSHMRAFCCCDNIIDNCVGSLEDNITCDPHCDTSFMVTIPGCPEPEPCSVPVFSDDFINSPAINANKSVFHFVYLNSLPDQLVWPFIFNCCSSMNCLIECSHGHVTRRM